LDETVRLIRQGRRDELDFEDLVDYLESEARHDRDMVERRLAFLIAARLIWESSPARFSTRLRRRLPRRRFHLRFDLKCRSLRRHADQSLAGCDSVGIAAAAGVTGRPPATFPAECPWTLDEL
jgi:hypothetical protein